MTAHLAARDGAVSLAVSNRVRHELPDDDARGHRVARRHAGQDGRIGDTQSIDAVDSESSIDHGHRVTAHPCGAGLMPVRAQPISEELLELGVGHRAGCDFASRERSQSG